MSSPLQFVSLENAEAEEDPEGMELPQKHRAQIFKNLKNWGFWAAFMKFGRGAASGFSVMAAPGAAGKSEIRQFRTPRSDRGRSVVRIYV